MNNKNINLFTQGQQIAARVLFIIGLFVSLGLGKALADDEEVRSIAKRYWGDPQSLTSDQVQVLCDAAANSTLSNLRYVAVDILRGRSEQKIDPGSEEAFRTAAKDKVPTCKQAAIGFGNILDLGLDPDPATLEAFLQAINKPDVDFSAIYNAFWKLKTINPQIAKILLEAAKNGRNHDYASGAAFGALAAVKKLRNFTAVLRQVRDESKEYRQLVTNYCNSENISI